MNILIYTAYRRGVHGPAIANISSMKAAFALMSPTFIIYTIRRFLTAGSTGAINSSRLYKYLVRIKTRIA